MVVLCQMFYLNNAPRSRRNRKLSPNPSSACNREHFMHRDREIGGEQKSNYIVIKYILKALLRWSVIKGPVRKLNEPWPERDSCVQRIRDRTSKLSLSSSWLRVIYVVIYYETTVVCSQLMWMFDQDKCFVTRELYRLRTLTSPNVLIMVERCAKLCLKNWYLYEQIVLEFQ